MTNSKPTNPLHEVLQHWKGICFDDTVNSSETRERLKIDACTFFRYIATNTQVTTTAQVVLQTKSSHEESIALVVEHLGPAFTSESFETSLRALHVLVGAIEGCRDSTFSNELIQKLGVFLVGHCRPIDDADVVDDYDSLTRDAAIQGLSLLLSVASSENLTTEKNIEKIEIRLRLAQNAIHSRCADHDDRNLSLQLTDRGLSALAGGLSTLSRSRRSLCFETLQAALHAVENVPSEAKKLICEIVEKETLQLLVDFATLASICLHGESDPRCLLQLLRILYKVQTSFHAFFANNGTQVRFPTIEIYDAVVPYYPIQFTPPSNDTHGITRDQLHRALTQILTFTKYDSVRSSDSMAMLSCGLFLEQLELEGDYGGTLDKVEAIKCLSSLLFEETVIPLLTRETVVRIAAALRSAHKISSRIATGKDSLATENKDLADQSRSFVAELACRLEFACHEDLWEAYIFNGFEHSAPSIADSPSRNKNLIALCACLASSGGIRTLRASLKMGMEPLLGYLEQGDRKLEDTQTALTGIGAFCSSYTAAVTKAMRGGVSWHPHPLSQYGDRLVAVLLEPLESEADVTEKCCSVRSLECFFLAAEENVLKEESVRRLHMALQTLFGSIEAERAVEQKEWSHSRASVLGTLLGQSLAATPMRPWLLRVGPIHHYLVHDVYKSLLIFTASKSQQKFAFEILAVCSRFNIDIAKQVTRSCMYTLEQALIGGNMGSIHASSRNLRNLIRSGGGITARAFHYLAREVSSLYDKLDNAFGSHSAYRMEMGEVLPLNVTATVRAAQHVHDAVCEAYGASSVEGALLLWDRAQESLGEDSNQSQIVDVVYLPLLVVALVNLQEEIDNESAATAKLNEKFAHIVHSLTQLLLARATSSRSSTQCAALLSVLLRQQKESHGCPIRAWIRSEVLPQLRTSQCEITGFHLLKVASVGCLAAISRGSLCWATAESLFWFILRLAWGREEPFPFASEIKVALKSEDLPTHLAQFTAASEVGAILANLAGSLHKQKLIFAGLKFVQQNQPIGKYHEMVLLRISSSLIVASNLSILAAVDFELLFSHIINGLRATSVFQDISITRCWILETQAIALISVMRILENKPSVVSRKPVLISDKVTSLNRFDLGCR